MMNSFDMNDLLKFSDITTAGTSAMISYVYGQQPSARRASESVLISILSRMISKNFPSLTGGAKTTAQTKNQIVVGVGRSELRSCNVGMAVVLLTNRSPFRKPICLVVWLLANSLPHGCAFQMRRFEINKSRTSSFSRLTFTNCLLNFPRYTACVFATHVIGTDIDYSGRDFGTSPCSHTSMTYMDAFHYGS